MRHSFVISLVLTCTAAVLAACGGDDGGGDSAGKYGTGLELGDEVVNSAKVGATVGPWYRWSREDCAFEETQDHPRDYRAEVRMIEGGDTEIGYMHYGNSDPFGVANSKSVADWAKKADMPLNVYNLKFPSRTEPVNAANNAVVKQDKGVLQANLDPSVLPRFYDVLEEEGCIPSVQLYLPVEGRPAMGNNWPDVGRVIGTYFAEEAKARGWKPEDTALVQCTDPDNGPDVNVMFKTGPEALAEGGFELPKENVFNLVCKLSEGRSGESRVVDWFTANPDFEHVLISTIDSPRMKDIINAVEREERPDEDTILAAGSDDESARRFVRAGQQDMSVSAFAERYGEWLIPMIQDLMAGNPVPAYVGVEMVPLTSENIDEYYPGE